VQAKTVELFRNLGLAEPLLRRGVLNTSIQFHIKGRPVGALDFDRARADDTPYQFILMAPQNEVEALLLEELARLGTPVERATELTSLTQSESAVTAVVTRNGQAASIVSRYVVGADGAHSLVRKQLGMPFEGAKYAQTFLLADCRIRWPYDHANFRIFMNGERIGLFLPLKGSEVSRVMATDLDTPPSGEHGLTRGPVELAALQDSLAKAMGVPIELSDPVWTTRYSVHMRFVDRYSQGRGFLVGDAAHIHSPAGGQGMNTGLLDAANLAWKLSMAVRTGAGAELLDTYDAERHPVGMQLMRFTDRLYRLTADLRGWRAALRDAIGPFLLRRMSAAPLPHRKSFRRLSQIGLEYAPSRINVNGLLYSLRGPVAGQRAPDARLRAGRHMFDLLAGYRLHVVLFSRKHLLDAEVTEYAAQLQSIGAFGVDLATHLVGRVECRHDPRVEQVESVQVFQHYGLLHDDSKALFVIRPDGHVAWRMDDVDFDACRSFLGRLHGGFAAYEKQRLAETAAP
jgi:2-polyprenyl-6-methoxyphenol hydroxylase-like FAD-dependent oxidoreductase